MDAFNTEAMKLSAMGVTVTVSSGDDGVASEAVLCNEPSGSADYGAWTVSFVSTSPGNVFVCLFTFFFSFPLCRVPLGQARVTFPLSPPLPRM